LFPGNKIFPAPHLNSPVIEKTNYEKQPNNMTSPRHKKLHPATREACERISQYLQEKRTGAGASTLARRRAAAIRQLPTYRQVRNQREVQP
jgi:hypothetical protein